MQPAMEPPKDVHHVLEPRVQVVLQSRITDKNLWFCVRFVVRIHVISNTKIGYAYNCVAGSTARIPLRGRKVHAERSDSQLSSSLAS
jgi:hypothetical protein